MNTPILKAIAEMSTYKDEELRFIKLDEEGLCNLLFEVDDARKAILDGEFLGVKIEIDE